MDHARAPRRAETFARLIGRLSLEIRLLTREIPLREGQLLELESNPPAEGGTVMQLMKELRDARQRLQEAEVDLVEVERLVAESGDRRP